MIYNKLTIWRNFTLVELLYVIAIVIMIPLGFLIFKLAVEGKLTWGHVLWINLLFG